MRSTLTVMVCVMRAFSVASRATISASSTARVRSISRRRVSSSLAMRASVTTRSCRMRAFSIDSRAAISASSTVRMRSISRWRTSRSEAMRAVSTAALVGDARLFDLLARQKLLFFHRARAFDFPVPGLALGRDASLGDSLLVGNSRLLDRFARSDLGLFGLGLAQRAFARDFGALQGAAHLDVTFLFEAGSLALALDIERLPLGLEVSGADLDHRVPARCRCAVCAWPRCPPSGGSDLRRRSGSRD